MSKLKDYVYKIAMFFSVALATVLCTVYVIEYSYWSIALIAGMLVAFPLQSFLHECGHILFGAMVRIKAVPHFSLVKSSSCTIIPKTDKGLKWRIVFTSLGGVFVNLIFAVFGLVALFYYAIPYWLGVFAPAALYFLILNAFPVTLYEGKTDGCVIVDLIKNTDESKVMLAVLTVQAQVLKGKPIEEVDEKLLFDLPVIREDDPAFISLTELRYEYFSAKGETEKAERYKERLEQLKEYL